MIIIGEKINGTIKSVAQAIKDKDADFIRNLTIQQTKAGADYIDVCASTSVDIEIETLKWMVNIVEEATDVPICIDSPNPLALKEILPLIKKPGMINSVSGEGDKADILFPLAKEYGFNIIALPLDNSGIPQNAEQRMEIARKLFAKAENYGVPQCNNFFDPMVIAVSTDNAAVVNFLNTMKAVKQEFPEVKITSGLSNVSFGMPLRKLVNRHFLCLAIYEGMDSAIMNPMDKDMRSSILATEAILGRDKHCRTYSKAYRKGEI